mmetsp:Transcript_82602/g.143336  ORF Transcript_82602/g.143336 Transcript_82602/m.143336 type:complete len:319 (-) Transcript_82602:15-971(-)
MVKCYIAFSNEDQRWTHNYDVEEGSTILELKEKMLAPKGGKKRDVDAFELRLRGQRVSDAEQIFQEHTLEFEYLGPEEGAKRAAEDAEDQKAREKAKAAAEEAAKRKAAAAAKAAEAPAKGGSRKPTGDLAVPEVPGVTLWKVVGGGDKGGILVRQGLQTSSPQLPDRLSTGAVVEEVELEGERLNYKRLTGTGPEEGWVSLTISGKALVQKARAEDAFTLERAIQMQKDLILKFKDPAFVQAISYIDDEFPDKKSAVYLGKRNMAIFGAQRDVVASYGFPGSQKGIMQMMGAYGPHSRDKEVERLGNEINKLLNLPQ